MTHRLVSRGLIVREGDPAGACSTWLRLTPEGVELAERAVRANAAAHEALFRDTPPAVVEAATGALRDLFVTITGLVANQARWQAGYCELLDRWALAASVQIGAFEAVDEIERALFDGLPPTASTSWPPVPPP